MSLQALLDEIRSRSEKELGKIEAGRRAEEGHIAAERDERIAVLRAEQGRQADADMRRVRAQLLAAATVNARKRVYEARERRLEGAIEAAREALREFTRSDEYPEVLGRMIAHATDRLGKPLLVSGREKDAACLSKIAGKSFDATPRAILGGLLAETPDGRRRLDLSFDELLRLREPRVRELFT